VGLVLVEDLAVAALAPPPHLLVVLALRLGLGRVRGRHPLALGPDPAPVDVDLRPLEIDPVELLARAFFELEEHDRARV
jgi:hypothetical protein